MAEIKIRIGKKSDSKSVQTKKCEKAGPIKEGEVSAQSGWIILECPWCYALNRCWDTPDYDVWICGWCGRRFS